MDIEALLEETVDAPPCGPDLEYDPEFLAIERALRPKAEQLVGEPRAATVDPDWHDLRRRCEALLARTKDLRLATMYLRALTHTRQLAGFADGMSFVSALLERYWNELHPALDRAEGNDASMRLNALAALAPPQGAGGEDTLFRELRSTLVVPPNQAGRVSVRDILAAAGTLAWTASEPAPTRAQNAAVLRHALQSDRAALAAPARALDAIDRIQDLLDERVGAERALDLRPLRDVVRTVTETVDEVEHVDAGQTSATAMPIRVANAPALAPRLTGEIRSRTEAVQLLEDICRFLEQTEPTNPAPLLLRRAQRLMTKSFVEIIEDMAPGALEQVRAIAGVRSEQ